MGSPAAKHGDMIVALDMHLVTVPPAPPVPVPFPFAGRLSGALSRDVRIMGQPAALAGSTATSTPHVPAAGTFVHPPSLRGTVVEGSATVRVNGRPLARAGDAARTCNDPADLPVGRVLAAGTVMVG